jgi:ADP-ribose pyrophosphatase YjhB (NUDIX family)
MNMNNSAGAEVRCSAVVFRGPDVLLVGRIRNGDNDWVLPGGTPRPGESMAACARRETLEETGLAVEPGRIAFVLETRGPRSGLHTVDLVFLANLSAPGKVAAMTSPTAWYEARTAKVRMTQPSASVTSAMLAPAPIDGSTKPTKISQRMANCQHQVGTQ